MSLNPITSRIFTTNWVNKSDSAEGTALSAENMNQFNLDIKNLYNNNIVTEVNKKVEVDASGNLKKSDGTTLISNDKRTILNGISGVDSQVTMSSGNLITSNGVATKINAITGTNNLSVPITLDEVSDTIAEQSSNISALQSGLNGLATVASSGSYNDLSNKPTLDSSITSSSTNGSQSKAVYNFVNTNYRAKVDQIDYEDDITNKPTAYFSVSNETLSINLG